MKKRKTTRDERPTAQGLKECTPLFMDSYLCASRKQKRTNGKFCKNEWSGSRCGYATQQLGGRSHDFAQ